MQRAIPSNNSIIEFIKDMYVTVNRLLSLAGRLLDSRHFASSSIRQVALLLEKGWKEFASLLDLRTQVLGLSVTFHQKAEQVTWGKNRPLNHSYLVTKQ